MTTKRLAAWSMVVFSVLSTPAALFWFAKSEPPFVIILSELALFFTGLDALWQAEQMED